MAVMISINIPKEALWDAGLNPGAEVFYQLPGGPHINWAERGYERCDMRESTVIYVPCDAAGLQDIEYYKKTEVGNGGRG